MEIRDRFVEVLADHGLDAATRWTVGSGFLVGGRYVLTSGHVAATKGTLHVRRIGSEAGSPKTMWPARVRLIGDADLADLALVQLDEDPGFLPPVGYARIDRHTQHTAVVEGCTAVGFPEFKKRGTGATALRETVQLDGDIPTSEDLGSGLLSLRVSQPQPRPLPPMEEALGRSPWSGISGAAALVDGCVVGVVSEHHPRAGPSALTLVPITFIDLLPDAEQWWIALGVNPARMMIFPHPDRFCVGELPPAADHYQLRSYSEDLESAMTSSELVVLSPERTALGSVGTTQLAGAYARRLWESREIDVLVWSRADDRDNILKIYQEAAAAAETEDFLLWLSRTDRRWLVVFDDLADQRHMEGLWPPDRPYGRVLVSTRDWQTLSEDEHCGYGRACRIEMGPFTVEEAIAYLMACLDCAADEAAELAHILRFQPVALAEAASYIRSHGVDCRGYCKKFGDRQRLLPRLLLGNKAPTDLQRSVVTVAWSLGVERRQVPEQGVLLSPARYEMTTSRDGAQTITLEVDGRFTRQILDRFFPPLGRAND